MSPEKVVVDQESKHLEQPRPVHANLPREKFPQQRLTLVTPAVRRRRRSLRLLIPRRRARLLPGGLVVRERAPAARFAPPAKEEPARRRGVRRGICRTIRRTIFGTRRTNSGPVSPGVARVDKVARVAPAALTQLPVPARPRPLPRARARVSPRALRPRRIVSPRVGTPPAATITFTAPTPARCRREPWFLVPRASPDVADLLRRLEVSELPLPREDLPERGATRGGGGGGGSVVPTAARAPLAPPLPFVSVPRRRGRASSWRVLPCTAGRPRVTRRRRLVSPPGSRPRWGT